MHKHKNTTCWICSYCLCAYDFRTDQDVLENQLRAHSLVYYGHFFLCVWWGGVVHMFVWVWILYLWTHMYVWWPKDQCLVSSLVTYFWTQTSSVLLGCPSPEFQGSTCHCLPSAGGFHMGAKCPNLGHHAYVACTLLTELSRQRYVFFLSLKNKICHTGWGLTLQISP